MEITKSDLFEVLASLTCFEKLLFYSKFSRNFQFYIVLTNRLLQYSLFQSIFWGCQKILHLLIPHMYGSESKSFMSENIAELQNLHIYTITRWKTHLMDLRRSCQHCYNHVWTRLDNSGPVRTSLDESRQIWTSINKSE